MRYFRESDKHGEPHYLPIAEKLTLRQVAAVFERVTGGVLPIEWGARPERAREIMKIEHGGKPLSGWQQRIALEDGFRLIYVEYKTVKLVENAKLSVVSDRS